MQEPTPAPAANFGDTVTFWWPGGLDIEGFQVTSPPLPAPMDLTAPVITDDGMGYNQVVIDLSADLVLAWDASAPADNVSVSVTSWAPDLVTGAMTNGSVTCTLVDDGQYTIPAALLAELPDPSGQEGGVSLSISRQNCATEQVTLTRGGVGNVVVICGWSVYADGVLGKAASPVAAR